MSIDLNTPPATSITIQPHARTESKPYEYKTGKKVAATEAEFLGHEGGFNFSDLLDVINPLQHIPIISTIYRAATGDEISAGAKMLGGGLLGGITGLLASAVDEIVKAETGSATGEKIYAALVGDVQSKTAETLDTAEQIVQARESEAAAMGSSLAAAALSESATASRELLVSARAANAAILPQADAAQSLATPMKQAASKYRDAQILAQLQKITLNATQGPEESARSKERRREELAADENSAWGASDPQYRDWLSQL